MKKVVVIVLAVLFVSCFVSTTFAATAGEVGAGMAQKLGRGLVNAASGWIELPKEMVNTGKENPLLGLTYGAVKGSAKTVVRTGAGGVETGTFLFPAPKNYSEPLIQPEYVFSK